jgi:hypothetical protein
MRLPLLICLRSRFCSRISSIRIGLDLAKFYSSQQSASEEMVLLKELWNRWGCGLGKPKYTIGYYERLEALIRQNEQKIPALKRTVGFSQRHKKLKLTEWHFTNMESDPTSDLRVKSALQKLQANNDLLDIPASGSTESNSEPEFE